MAKLILLTIFTTSGEQDILVNADRITQVRKYVQVPGASDRIQSTIVFDKDFVVNVRESLQEIAGLAE